MHKMTLKLVRHLDFFNLSADSLYIPFIGIQRFYNGENLRMSLL